MSLVTAETSGLIFTATASTGAMKKCYRIKDICVTSVIQVHHHENVNAMQLHNVKQYTHKVVLTSIM